MLRVLLAKDLRRAWRNPLPWVINLIVPLAMTALIGMVFGGHSDSGALGRIRFAVVDEDKTVLSDFLRGSASQREGGKYLEPVFMEREDALRQVNVNQISAVVIIPTNFMRNYFLGREAVSLELIKNPAESIHPAVLEELLGAVVTALNAISRNFQSEFPEWQAVFEGREDYHKVSMLIERAGDKLKTAKKYINPPLVSYEKEERTDESKSVESKSGATNSVASKGGGSGSKPAKSSGSKGGSTDSVFAFLLIGMAAMFLLFLASNGMSDLLRELRQRTFERYQTMYGSLVPFIAGKAVFSVVMLMLCSAVMLGGGGLIFRIHWQQPVALLGLTFAYNCFVSALFAVLVALVPDERRAGVLNNIVGMGLGLVGGCAFPARQLPAFLREHITPLMPSNWFVEAVRNLQFGSTGVAWGLVALKLAALSVVLIGLAALLFRRRFKTGSARMKRILDIGHTDYRLFLKHKSAYVWLFVVPLAFVYFMGFANRGPGDPYNRTPPVLIENADTNFLGRILLDELSSQKMWLLNPTNRESAARVIRIPADFTSRVLQQEQSKVQFLRRDGSAEADAALIEVRLVRALIAMNGHLLEAATATNQPGVLTEEKLRTVMAAPNPVSLMTKFAGRKPVPSGFNFSLPGNLVMYLMMNLLIFGGASVAAERRNGVIKRLMVHPVTRLELVMGKIYGLMLLGAVQIVFFLAVGKFLFHVNLGANLPAVTLTLLVFAWVAGSFGVLVGSLTAAEDRVIGICVLASLLMAAMGGCWWPLEIGPPSLKVIALCLPTGWALQALHQLISFGSGLGAVVTPLAVLLAFGVAANLMAARFFRS